MKAHLIIFVLLIAVIGILCGMLYYETSQPEPEPFKIDLEHYTTDYIDAGEPQAHIKITFDSHAAGYIAVKHNGAYMRSYTAEGGLISTHHPHAMGDNITIELTVIGITEQDVKNIEIEDRWV